MARVSRHGDFGREMDLKRWKNGKTGIGDDSREMGRVLETFSRFPVHFPFFFRNTQHFVDVGDTQKP
jgi:hypothetical protein